MGNCSLKGVTGECPSNNVRLLTNSGGVVELRGPKLAKYVLNEYPGHGIFRQGNPMSPLSGHEYLISGQVYYILPLKEEIPMLCDTVVNTQAPNMGSPNKENIDSTESPNKKSSVAALDFGEERPVEDQAPTLQVLPCQGNGVWKVKLMINTKQLEEILSEQGNTEALIEKMRMAAASSASLAPRRSKSFWGISDVFKVFPLIDSGK